MASDAPPGPERSALSRIRTEAVRAALHELSARDRNLLLLWIDGRTDEVRTNAGAPAASTVRGHVRQARLRLRAELERRGGPDLL
jgi:DNA-directed RNA polymerase specialized sigma24 family protein